LNLNKARGGNTHPGLKYCITVSEVS